MRGAELSVRRNHFHFGNSCVRHELSVVIDVGEVLVDGGDADTKQITHLALGHPKCFAGNSDFDADALLGSIDQKPTMIGIDRIRRASRKPCARTLQPGANSSELLIRFFFASK